MHTQASDMHTLSRAARNEVKRALAIETLATNVQAFVSELAHASAGALSPNPLISLNNSTAKRLGTVFSTALQRGATRPEIRAYLVPPIQENELNQGLSSCMRGGT